MSRLQRHRLVYTHVLDCLGSESRSSKGSSSFDTLAPLWLFVPDCAAARYVNFTFSSANKGFEGLAPVPRHGGVHYWGIPMAPCLA